MDGAPGLEVFRHQAMEDSMIGNLDTSEPAVHLDKIGQIAITVSDLERSREFYRNVLGMKFLFDAGTMAFFQCGEIRLMIGASKDPVTPGGTILYFKVQDIHQTHDALKQQGVVFQQAPLVVAKMPEHDLWLAFMKDPDENVLGLMSEVPRA
jgi:methylmalonyl-CoA/ethylmalonyl-CoA epimerase